MEQSWWSRGVGTKVVEQRYLNRVGQGWCKAGEGKVTEQGGGARVVAWGKGG